MTQDSICAVILGASQWPKSPLWESSPNFTESARALKNYLLTSDGLGIAALNILDLFDDPRPVGEIDYDIELFLEAAKTRGAKDILIYYTGHGAFVEGDNKYCLALRSSHLGRLSVTGYRVSALSKTIGRAAPYSRIFAIIDACYSGAALGDLIPQGDVATRIEMDAMDALPDVGVALLCAASSADVALAPRTGKYTMFSSGLIFALTTGSKEISSNKLSISDLKNLSWHHIKRAYHLDAVRPEIHIPDQRQGDISNVRIFPNPAADHPSTAAELHSSTNSSTPSDLVSSIAIDPTPSSLSNSNAPVTKAAGKTLEGETTSSRGVPVAETTTRIYAGRGRRTYPVLLAVSLCFMAFLIIERIYYAQPSPAPKSTSSNITPPMAAPAPVINPPPATVINPPPATVIKPPPIATPIAKQPIPALKVENIPDKLNYPIFSECGGRSNIKDASTFIDRIRLEIYPGDRSKFLAEQTFGPMTGAGWDGREGSWILRSTANPESRVILKLSAKQNVGNKDDFSMTIYGDPVFRSRVKDFVWRETPSSNKTISGGLFSEVYCS